MVFKRVFNKRTLSSNIMINLHRVEKGLTFQSIKPLFGRWFFKKLYKDLDRFERLYGEGYPQNTTKSALAEYKNYHLSKNFSSDLFPLCLINESNKTELSGTKYTNELKTEEKNYFFNLAKSRSSIRNFTSKAPLDDIKSAIEVSIKTPSVCNRQPWKAYYYQSKEQIKELLQYQNGNVGFRESIPSLIIVTGNLKEMEFTYERHQLYIDGGLFSMTIIYALHSLGIGSCCLNWCSKPYNDWKAHKKAGIPLDEEIIMYIAVGLYDQKTKVTCSPKKPITDILHVK